MRSLLQRGAQRGHGPPWGNKDHPGAVPSTPTHGMGHCELCREPQPLGTAIMSPGGWKATARGWARWGCLLATPLPAAPTRCTAPVPPRASRPDNFPLFCKTNYLLQPSFGQTAPAVS